MPAAASTIDPVAEIAPGVFRVTDTCQVYVVRAEDGSRTGFAVDFGSGLALEHLPEMGIDRITDVLMTHHHRDQGQGLPRAAAAGIRIHVPPVERELFERVDEMWLNRPFHNDYNLRQDRFSVLEPVTVQNDVPEYRHGTYAGTRVEVIPTPGHTTGSVTYLVERAGQRLAFTGDLIYAPGKVWSLASTQWSYTENEGPAMTTLSCWMLIDRQPSMLLPSHGEPMHDPAHALGLLAERMGRYVDSRRPLPWDLRARLDDPYTRLTEHLLMNRTSISCGYVLLSKSGAALLFDYGYDMTTGLPAGTDRAARRPWLGSLPALRKDYGVTAIEAALPTHYHDDHVAGMNLLREVWGTEVWAPANVAPVLESPLEQDLPCLWYDPIPVDRRLALGMSFTWHEYEITVHELPGHTLYAAAYEFVVDGVKVLVTGDQQVGSFVAGERREVLNYQYRNRFRPEDYRASAALYRRVSPGLIVSGHWGARWVDEAYLSTLEDEAEQLVTIHHELLPLEELNLGADSILARVKPYYQKVTAGNTVGFTVSVQNPNATEAKAALRPVLPPGWIAEPDAVVLPLPPSERAETMFTAFVPGPARRRARIAVEVTIGELNLGQHAEALFDVVDVVDVADMG